MMGNTTDYSCFLSFKLLFNPKQLTKENVVTVVFENGYLGAQVRINWNYQESEYRSVLVAGLYPSWQRQLPFEG